MNIYFYIMNYEVSAYLTQYHIRKTLPSTPKALYWLLSCMRLLGSYPFCSQSRLHSCRGNPRGTQVGGTSAGLLSHTLPTAGSAVGSDQASQAITQPGIEKCQRLEAAPPPCVLAPPPGHPCGQKASYLTHDPWCFALPPSSLILSPCTAVKNLHR